MLPQAELAYAAGLIDGEGSIVISRTHRYRNPSFQLVLSVSNTDRRMVEWLHDRFGGSLSDKAADHRTNRRRVFDWRVRATDAAAVLCAVQPFLVVKGRQAEIGLAFQARASNWPKGCVPLTVEEVAARDALRAELHRGRRRAAAK